MDNQEALNRVDAKSEEFDEKYSGARNMHEQQEDIAILQNLVNKSIPKKVIHNFGWGCPNKCKDNYETVGNFNINYCPNCGQALDWSK